MHYLMNWQVLLTSVDQHFDRYTDNVDRTPNHVSVTNQIFA